MNRFMRYAIAAVLVMGGGFIHAQTSQGRILGRLTDPSGAVVANARITITNTATGVTRNLNTTGAGEYAAPNLDPGTYTVTAEASGFKKAETSPFLLEVSRDVRQDLRLEPGDVGVSMTITAEETLVDLSNSTLNGVLSSKAVSELPVQGRDFQNLLELHPGVQRSPGGGFHAVTSNGNRYDDNNFFIDGADDNDVYYGETVINDAGIQGTPASTLPLDAIQEFNTQESPSADYGVKPGVVMNIGIKSGANTVHGSAYYFHRNSAFDARNYFNPTGPVSALLLHQFGASVGGPIKKDKWFYFLNYEGIRDRVGNPAAVDSPVTTSIGDSTFSIVDAVASCQAAGTCSPLSLSLTNLFLPNPGSTLNASDPGLINFNFNNKNRSDNVVGKSTFHINERETLSGLVIYSNSDQTEEDASPLRPEWLSTTQPKTKVFGISLASAFNSAWTNELRYSWNSFNEAIGPVDQHVSPAKYGLNTGVTDPRLFGFPRINPGTNEFNYMGGNSSWPLYTTPSKTQGISDTATYTRGNHSLRFGGNYRFGDVSYYRAGYGRGRVDFRNLDDFVMGNVRRWRFLYGDPTRDISLKSFGLFVQDDFRVAHNLTLNLGLRYDVTYPIKDSHNQLANYDPNSPTGIVQVGQGIKSPYSTNYNNISPRVGLAWDVHGTGKTVLRAAYGIIFEQPSIRTFAFNGGGLNLNPTGIPFVDGSGNVIQPTGNITSFLQVSNDSSLINWSQAGPIFPQGASINQCSPSVPCSIFGVDQHLKTPYVMNWNFNIQQELTKSTVLQVAYVANRGVKLYSVTDPNQVNAALVTGSEQSGRPLTTNCPVLQGGQGLGGPCFPYIGFMSFLSNRSNSNYHSLQATLTKRYSRGLYLLAGYTWAHAIDTATSNLAGVPPDSTNYKAERGNGDEDIRHRLTLSVVYELPSVKSKWQMLEGWQATSILNLQTGRPYTLGDFGNDISGTGELNDRWNITGPANNIHWSAKNSVPFIDFSNFNTVKDATDPTLVHVTTGADATAQRCVDQAFAMGGQSAADQLVGGPSQVNTGGCYISGNTIITPPALGTQGNMGRNIFRGPDFKNLDFSLSKTWKLNERLKVQFRGEVFNILNHANFASLNTDLSGSNVGLATLTPDVAAANPVVGSGGSRHIQLAVKVLW